jgi:glycosyltransferase domain-containing protein
MSDKNILDNLTIIIFTYKRYEYLKRVLDFYFSYNYSYNFLILDSTPYEPYDSELLILLNSNKNIKWIKYDESIFFIDKIEDGSKYLNTEYSVLCADDDFIFPSALINSIEFLKQNLTYSSCHGLSYHYAIENNNKLNFGLIYGKRSGGDENEIFDRLNNYLRGKTVYYPFYAVQRTEQFKIVWGFTKLYAIDWAMGEIFPCAASLVLGKMKILNCAYSVREPNNFKWYDEDRMKIMYDIKIIDKSIVGLTELIIKKGKVGLEMVDKRLIESFDYLLIRTFKRKFNDSNEVRILTFISKLKNYIKYKCNKIIFNYKYKSVSKRDYNILLAIIIKHNIFSINDSRLDYSDQNNDK